MQPDGKVSPTLYHALHPKGPAYVFLQTFDMNATYPYEYIRDALIRAFPTVPRSDANFTTMKSLTLTKLMGPSHLMETLKSLNDGLKKPKPDSVIVEVFMTMLALHKYFIRTS